MNPNKIREKRIRARKVWRQVSLTTSTRLNNEIAESYENYTQAHPLPQVESEETTGRPVHRKSFKKLSFNSKRPKSEHSGEHSGQE